MSVPRRQLVRARARCTWPLGRSLYLAPRTEPTYIYRRANLAEPSRRSMPEIYGNTKGLAPSAIKTLEHIYRRKIPLERVATPELLRSLSEASRQTGRQVGALVHRSGQVDYVVVGDAQRLFLPDIGRLRAAEGRFRALRLIHTHLHGEPLTRDDLVDLVRLRLDLIAAVQLAPDGNPRAV